MTEVEYFFSGWQPLGRIVVVGTLLFLSVVLLLRITGNRTLSSLNTFDFIVTVAVGAVFGRALTAKDLSLSEALAAIVLLIGLQYLLSLLKFHFKSFSKAITSEPVVLYSHGTLRQKAMRRERITEDDILAAVRAQGHTTLEEIDTVVLEATGNMSVFEK
ncbi:DUF421 domain-containing protein [Deinococcus peraridilitoris]|uniref:Putative membrane protein n=1 Tax=Deinococcus peraridilitoris (strain DSM 19664 / LMG 22246 / CIP 109416 / KR-200) TaxID=937777 RepID=K9ZX03_DEIPD|nr:YetF domain-containing protein [Deinococcus peraridilitoris]AFZ66168.1 putative membrane protein [Deinococcus peraridilitoris DSM 19664]